MFFSNSGRSEFRGVNMVHKIGVAVLGAGLLLNVLAMEGPTAVYKPLNFGGFSEFGSLQSGQYANNKRFNDEWVDHFGAYIAQTVQSGDDLAFDIGLGGVFVFQKRELIHSTWGGSQYKNFFVGPSVADIRYGASAGNGKTFGLQFGMFTEKYNPDANNLGEYLFRSGTYPDYVTSGGIWFVNNTSVQLQALKASYKAGAFTSDYFLITETSLPALYDISAAAVVEYKMGDGLLDLGAGINFKHMIPVKPSLTSSHNSSNAYFTKDGVDYTGYDAFYSERKNFYGRRQVEDSANASKYKALAVVDSINSANVKTWLKDPVAAGITPKYFTQQGLIVMARASLDLKKIIHSEAFGPNDMRLYAEGAILGIQNYPVYYTHITERMPLMAGFNIPCFKFLDLLSAQVEYFNSPYLNSYLELVRSSSGIPTSPLGSDVRRSKTEYGDITKNDNLAWSFLAKKTLGGAAFVSAQVARDHIRTVSIDTWTAPEPNEVLGNKSDWYWMIQFGFGI